MDSHNQTEALLASSEEIGAEGTGPDRTGGEPEFLRIGDMAKTFDVTLRTLRFYEDKGLLSPKRDGNTRLYSQRDRSRMKLIMLGRKVGFSLRDVKQVLDLYDPAGTNNKQMRLVLDKSEKQMVRLHKQQAALEEAVQELGELIATVRARLGTAAPAERKAG